MGQRRVENAGVADGETEAVARSGAGTDASLAGVTPPPDASLAGVTPMPESSLAGVTPPDASLAGVTPPDAELAARLRLLVMRLYRRLRARAGDELSPTLTAALVSVERHGPLTLGRLAELERVTPPSITRAVSALEGAGLVSRVADADDRRVARLSITPEGERLLQESRTRKTAYLAERLAELDAAELAAVSEALPVLERLLDAEP